jgi:multidrug efflux pump subunit AcrB
VDQIYPTNREATHHSSPKLFQILVVTMAIALVTTVILGVILAFRSIRKPWLVCVSLILGFLVPVALLWLGRHQ